MTEQKKTQKPKKRKLSIADLQTKPKRLTLVHPDESIDLGDAWVELIPPQSSLEYILFATQIAESGTEDLSLAEQVIITAQMVTSVITDWDEDSFGVPFSKESAIELFSKPDNFWIRALIQEAAGADSDFFN